MLVNLEFLRDIRVGILDTVESISEKVSKYISTLEKSYKYDFSIKENFELSVYREGVLILSQFLQLCANFELSVIVDNHVVITGKICGIAMSYQPSIGLSYIVEVYGINSEFSDKYSPELEYGYTHVVLPQAAIKKL